ncbi:DNA polymerase III subunit beta [candidate division SR1 bacterium Aalborg_AAW-1]|nr:DNA polymerase III subunit beta [candidate division SR1 bacterium Aalborg_AAW-1]
MKLSLEVSLLSELLDLSTRFIAKSSTLPILQNIYIAVVDNEVTIKATDMEKYILIHFPIDKAEDGGITVDAKTFFEIIKTIEDDHVELSVSGDNLSISSAKDSFTIKGLPLQEFVALPDLKEPKTIEFPVATLTAGIGKVEFAVLEKNFSPVFTGVLMTTKHESGKDSIVFVGTDSYRLAEYKTPYEGKAQEMKVIIPKSSINDIKKVGDYCTGKGQHNNVIVNFSHNMILCEFTIGNMSIKTNSLLIQGNFPDYDNEKILPKNFNTTITVDSSATDKAIRKIGILTKDNNNFIHLVSQDNILEISSGNTDLGQANTSISAIIDKGDINVGLNGKHVADFMKIANSDRINMNFVDNTSPIVLMEPDSTVYKYVIRPVK